MLTLKGYIDLYHEWGISFIPVQHRSKVPALKEGEIQTYRIRQPNQEEIKQWFFNGSQHNIAAVCGFNNLVCLDFDDQKVFDVYIAGKPLPDTFVTRSARGVHVYFFNDKLIHSIRYEGLKVELLGFGALSTLPPSVHPSGTEHTVLNMKPVKQVFGIEKAFNEFARSQGFKPKPFSERAIAKVAREGVKEGERNLSLFRYAVHMLKVEQLQIDHAEEALLRANSRCMPPLLEREVLLILDSAVKRVKEQEVAPKASTWGRLH